MLENVPYAILIKGIFRHLLQVFTFRVTERPHFSKTSIVFIGLIGNGTLLNISSIDNVNGSILKCSHSTIFPDLSDNRVCHRVQGEDEVM